MSSRKPKSHSKSTKSNGTISSKLRSDAKKSENKALNNGGASSIPRPGRLSSKPDSGLNYAGYNDMNVGGLSSMPPLNRNYAGNNRINVGGISSMPKSNPNYTGYNRINGGGISSMPAPQQNFNGYNCMNGGYTSPMHVLNPNNTGYNRMHGGSFSPASLDPKSALDDKYLQHNKFVKYYMDTPYRPSKISSRAHCDAERPTVPQALNFVGQNASPEVRQAYFPSQEELRKENEAFTTNLEYGVIRHPVEPPINTLCGGYRSRGNANRVLNRAALNKELCQMPFLHHIYNPNKLLSQYYCRDRDGPSRVAPGLGLGFLSRPNRSQYRRPEKKAAKPVASVPICCPPATYEFSNDPCMLHYRLLNGPRLREELESQPEQKEALDPYKVVPVPDCDELYEKLVCCFDDVSNKSSLLDIYCRCCNEGQTNVGKQGDDKGAAGGYGGRGGRGGHGEDDDKDGDGKDGKGGKGDTDGKDGRFGDGGKFGGGKGDKGGKDGTGKDGTDKDGVGKDGMGKGGDGKDDPSKFGDGKGGKGGKGDKGDKGDKDDKDEKGGKGDKGGKGGKDGKGGKGDEDDKDGAGGKGKGKGKNLEMGEEGEKKDKDGTGKGKDGKGKDGDLDMKFGDSEESGKDGRGKKGIGHSSHDNIHKIKSTDGSSEGGRYGEVGEGEGLTEGSEKGEHGSKLHTSEGDGKHKHKGGKKGKKGKKVKKVEKPEPETEIEEIKHCPCPICDMNRKSDPPPAWMTEMINDQNKRDLKNYYRRMKQKECEKYQSQKYPAPQHKADPIKCSNKFCLSPTVVDATECLKNLQVLHRFLDNDKSCLPKRKQDKLSECWDPNCMEIEICKLRKALHCDCKCL